MSRPIVSICVTFQIRKTQPIDVYDATAVTPVAADLHLRQTLLKGPLSHTHEEASLMGRCERVIPIRGWRAPGRGD